MKKMRLINRKLVIRNNSEDQIASSPLREGFRERQKTESHRGFTEVHRDEKNNSYIAWSKQF